ncbi:hypothetical protein HZC31_03195 [Candidatus Woesearchaeota archaeon]|nr:hypothetical protein [Candidatus Woesearchaeota archaeon]
MTLNTNVPCVPTIRNITNPLLYGLIALTPFQFEGDDAVWRSDEEIASVIIPYVDANYERIAQEMEQQYGITFSSVPSYTYDAHPTSDANAHYDPDTGAITFHTAGAFDADGLAKAMTILRVTRRQFRQELEGTIRHELAHDYFFERAEAVGMNTYWNEYIIDHDGHPEKRSIAKHQIAEGVAEYMSGRKRDDKKETYELVEPILSLTCKEGIDVIVQNPLLSTEWNNLPAYTHRLLEIVK